MRQATRITPDRETLLSHVAAHPGMWGDDLRDALGWTEGRFWNAVACPLFDCCTPGVPSGYRLTEAGLAESQPERVAAREAEREAARKAATQGLIAWFRRRLPTRILYTPTRLAPVPRRKVLRPGRETPSLIPQCVLTAK